MIDVRCGFLALLLLLLLPLLMPGCTSPAPGPAPDLSLAPDELALSACHGAQVQFTVPAALHPGTPPPGWAGPVEADAISSTFLEAWQCERLAWGDHERPITFVAAIHDHFSPPTACAKDGAPLYVLETVWVNDAEIAASLRAAWDIPIQSATFAVNREGPDAVQRVDWSWEANDTAMRLMSQRISGQSASALEARWVWPAGPGLGMLAWTAEFGNSSILEAQAQGPQTPLNINGHASGPGFGYDDADAAATLQRHEDPPCA